MTTTVVKMAKRTSAAPKLSEAEWEVMKVVWDVAPHPVAVPASTIVEAVLGGAVPAAASAFSNDRSPKTIKTLLTRLVAKGAVAVNESATPYLYSAAVERDALVKQASKNFLHRVFDGAAGAALVHLIHESRLTAKELAEVKGLLERKSK